MSHIILLLYVVISSLLFGLNNEILILIILHFSLFHIQAPRDSSRRLARCSLCGGSVYISSHFFVRLGSPSDPPPAHTSPHSTPVWRRWAVPPPNPPPAHASPQSPPLWRQEPHQSQQSSPPLAPEPFASSAPPAPEPSVPPVPPVPPVQPQSLPTQHVLLVNSPLPAHPPLQPPLMRSNSVLELQHTTQVLSPPQLFGGSSSPSSPSPALLSPSPLSPSPTSPPPPPPPPLPPPLVSQVSLTYPKSE